MDMTTKRIISFDVGIKNMAYCIFDVLSQSSDIPPIVTIVDWNILNISKSIEPSSDPTSASTIALESLSPPTCMHVLSTSKKKRSSETELTTKCCGKKSKYHKDGFYVCEKHAKESQKYLMPKSEYTEKSLQKRKLDDLKSFVQQQNVYFFTGIPEKIKKQELIDKVVQTFQPRCWEENPKPKKETKAGDIDLISIGRNLYAQLSQNPYMQTVTHVVIENQISPIANRMKTIQGMLAQVFIFYQIPIIEFVSSANKLKDFVKAVQMDTNEESKTGTVSETTKKKSSSKIGIYKQHKNDAVVFCRQFLSTYFENLTTFLQEKDWVHFFNSHGKKDDLADAFLQGIWYINKKIITNADNLKINNVTTP